MVQVERLAIEVAGGLADFQELHDLRVIDVDIDGGRTPAHAVALILLRALLLGKDIGNQIVEKARLMQPDGLLLNAARPNLLRFMPALNVTTEEIDQMMAMLRSILDTL